MSLCIKEWQWMVCVTTLILFTNCTKRENLPEKIASIRQNIAVEPGASVKELETLNMRHPDNPEILLALSDAYIYLPGNNHLRAAVHLERAAKILNGQGNTWLRAARLFAEAGDISAQLENLCLHLQYFPNEEAWLDLGQILIQSDRQQDLEVAQQILFGRNDDRPNAVQLKVLLNDLQQNNLITEGSTARGLQAVQTIRLMETEVISEIIQPEPVPPPPSLPTPLPESTTATSPTAAILTHLPPLPIPPPVSGKTFGTESTSPTGSIVVQNINDIEIIETPPQVTENIPENPTDIANLPLTAILTPEPSIDKEYPSAPVSTESKELEDIKMVTPHKPETSSFDIIEQNSLELANEAFDSKDYEKASTLYWKAVRTDPENPELWYQLSRSFFRQNSIKKAEMMALEAARRDPANPEYVVHFLKVIREQEDPENFHAELKKARKLFPDDPFIIYELAVSYANTDGDIRAAVILFQEFLEKHPAHDLASSAADSIKELHP